MDQQTVEKFFNDTCTAEEAKQVVQWLGTDEGQQYLSDRLDRDAELLKNQNVKPLVPDSRTEQIWKNIEKEVSSAQKSKTAFNHQRGAFSYGAVAAIVLLAFGVMVFLSGEYLPIGQPAQTQQPIHFATNAHQQKKITLSDGTQIRLNRNSQLWIAGTYGRHQRVVTLKGEAYFEVTHNPAKPFIIHTGKGIVIKDLGTAFQVETASGENNVQVAVKEGKVAILRKKVTDKKENTFRKATELSAGQYAYVNLKAHSISVHAFQVKNYFSWISDRLRFDNASLARTSRQLSRIYEVRFSFAADSLKKMRFSATFERESLRRTVAIIALTLSIDYTIKNNQVIWKK